MVQDQDVKTVTGEILGNKTAQVNHSVSKKIMPIKLLDVALAKTGDWTVKNAALKKDVLNAKWAPGYSVVTALRRCGDIST